MGLVTQLPPFPWDSLTPYRATAEAHDDGIVDLSVGTPVDPTPEVVRRALAAAADSPGYPATYGTPALREAIVAHYARRRGVPGLDPDGVLPTIGSKEMVATLPAWLGLGAGDAVLFPEAAYPTYDIGARLAGATPVPLDLARLIGPDGEVGGEAAAHLRGVRPRLVWINSPSNPAGEVLDAGQLAAIVRWARAQGAVVAADECYAELNWSAPEIPSVLDRRVNGGDTAGVLALYSLSKQSNLAGYRAAWIAGDTAIIASLLELRKHAGLIMPGPIQAAMAAAVADDGHVEQQKERYRARREQLRGALALAGFELAPSEAGLYLWASRGEDCWASVDWLARRGILVAPGAFYGEAARGHVRVALTATDERVAAAAARLRP